MGASMGPQLYRCGNVLQRSVWSDGMGASMGPQLYRCGNTACANSLGSHTTRFNGAAILSLRKFMSLGAQNKWKEQLQWGRNFIVAE